MSLEYNIILNAYSIIIILIIYLHALRFFEKESLQDRLYMIVLYVTVVMLCLDVLSRFDGYPATIYPVINAFGNFMIFLMSPVLPSFWLAYVHLQVFSEERKTKRLLYPLCIINIINAVILIISQSFGWIYYIDSYNIYHRGPLFLIPAFIVISLILVAFVITLINRRRLDKKSFLALVFFLIPPFISIILQIIFYGISLMLNCVVISLLVVFLNLQNHSIYTDHLTGVNNRKRLDAYLKEKVNSRAEEKDFSAILIDINNFKYINDTCGHDVGDIALETSAKLLESCLRANDFIARFGGDEFCIVLDVSSESDLEAMVCRINNCFEKYNESGSHLYQLTLSMGYAVYGRSSRLSAEEFLKQIDTLMYEEKQAYKHTSR